jgi:hypothetical protein
MSVRIREWANSPSPDIAGMRDQVDLGERWRSHIPTIGLHRDVILQQRAGLGALLELGYILRVSTASPWVTFSMARYGGSIRRLGVPRDIVSPGVVQVVIQENRWKQAELERASRLELLDDLPRTEVLFVGIGTDEVEVELVGKSFGEEVGATVERFQVKELIFDEA